MNEKWGWIVRYAAVIVITLVLALALGSMGLFKSTTIAGERLSAADFVEFLGFGGALAVFWLTALRASRILAEDGGRWSFVHYALVPIATLIVVAGAHSVLLLLLQPFLGTGAGNFYNWVFIIAILAAAGWLLLAVMHQSANLSNLIVRAAPRPQNEPTTELCRECGAPVQPDAQFCGHCGIELQSG
jgi:hypothetical protein